MNSMEIHFPDLKIGERIFRKDLHEKLGGQTQSRISPSVIEDVILLFSYPALSDQYGHNEGWDEDGYYHYFGEGDNGDQIFQRGNKAILESLDSGKEIHLFLGSSKDKPFSYEGQFKFLDYYQSDGSDGKKGNGVSRKVIKFRLKPLNREPVTDTLIPEIPKTYSTEIVDLESSQTEKYYYAPLRAETSVEKKEGELVKRYVQWKKESGVKLKRLRINLKHEEKPIFVDLFNEKEKQIIEAKGSVARESLRNAVGHIQDCERFVEEGFSKAVLLPEKPREDLMLYLKHCNVGVIYPAPQGFIEDLDQ